jgi:phosphoribosylformimino-5-aminoimidazole carboxamide ribonucleotide (ProFAR) isomerase
MEPEKRNIQTIPAIYIYKGYPVTKSEDVYEPLKDDDGGYIKINEVIEKLSEEHEKLLITDLSGVRRDRPQLDLLKSISTKMELWVDPGTRYGTGVIDVLVSGADNVVIGTKTLRGLSELEKACELSENIIIDINYDDGIVSPDKEIQDTPIPILAEKVREIGIKTLIFTDLKHITSGSSFEINAGRSSIVSGMDVYFHGMFDKESRAFEKMDVKGLIMENIDLV